MFSVRFMSSLRMNTRDVIGTGFSFLFVIIVLHVIVGILWYAGFFLFNAFWEGFGDPNTASWIFGLLFWIPAGIILLCGYIGLWTKLLTDSIAVGIYKANNAGDDVDLEVKLPWGGEETPAQSPQSQPALDTPSADSTLNEMNPVIGQFSEDGQWKWDGSDWAPAS